MSMHQSMLLLELCRLFGGNARAKPPPAIDPALLILALAASQGGKDRGSHPPHSRELRRMRGMSLAEFTRDYYVPGKGHDPNGATAILARTAVKHLRQCEGKETPLGGLKPEVMDRFRAWQAARVEARQIAAPTANRDLRHLRSVWNYAARRRTAGKPWARRAPSIDFLPEEPPEVTAWTAEELDRLEERARSIDGPPICGAPPAVWWPAWLLVFSRIGPRVTAMMATRREDFAKSALLLRRETQKQKQDQRIALPSRAAAAVERLLAAHAEPLIFPWPFDPPRPGRRKGWVTLTRHFRRLLLEPCGLTLPKGVATRQFRRTAATVIDEAGGNSQALLGHSAPSVTRRYKDRRRMPICREALRFPDGERQRELPLE